MHDVIDNRASHRFEVLEQGQVAFADYRFEADIIAVTHVEAPIGMRGTGAATRLMQGLLSIVRDRHLKIRPLCAYARDYMERHPEYADLCA